jgi:plasmid stabilization system protein ParE
LAEIEAYIAQVNPAAAENIVARITTSFLTLTIIPRMGHVSPYLPRYRQYAVRGHIVFYTVLPRLRLVQIHRIIDGRRDLPAVMDGGRKR